jgi:hypothetical protein
MHVNKQTGATLTRNQGVCGGCYQNFSGDRAFDAHRTGPHDARSCMPPEQAGLLPRLNSHGTTVWGREYEVDND